MNDPRHPRVARRPQVVPPYLNFAPLSNAAARLARAAERYEKALAQASEKDGAPLARPGAREVNTLLRQAEHALTLPDGLPGRPWFKHQIYAPGVYTGYSVKTMPGVREAIEGKQWKEAEQQIVRVAGVLETHAALVEQAAGELAGLR